MRPILAIAGNTYREAIRDRVFHSLLAFGVVIVLSSLVLDFVTVGDRTRIVMDIGLAAIHLFGVLVAIALGTGLVYKEISKRTVFTLLSKPIPRWQFVIGKYLGLVAVLAVQVLLMTLVFHALYLPVGGSLAVGTFQAIGLVVIELMVLTGVVLVFSSFAAPLTSGFLSILFFLLGHLIGELAELTKNPRIAKHPASGLWDVAFRFFPDLELFNLKEEALYRIGVSWVDVGLAATYGLAWSAFFVTVACLLLSRREFD